MKDQIQKSILDTLSYFKQFNSPVLKISELFEFLNTSELKFQLKAEDFYKELQELLDAKKIFGAKDESGIDHVSLENISEADLLHQISLTSQFRNNLKELNQWLTRFTNKKNILYIGVRNPLLVAESKSLPKVDVVVKSFPIWTNLLFKIFPKKFNAEIKVLKNADFLKHTESLYHLLGYLHLHSKDDYYKNLVYKRLKELKNIGNFPISKI